VNGTVKQRLQSQEEGLAYPTITGAGEKECTTPTAGKSQQNFAASFSHQIGINE
jgi:hypothetical protein